MTRLRDPGRRAFLGDLLRAAACAAATSLVGCAGRDPIEEGLAGFFASRASARAVGEEVLGALASASAGRRPGAPELVRRLVRGRPREWSSLSRAGPEALSARLRAQHHEDFESGRLLSVRGWLLSETEALLAALVALAPQAP